MIVLRVCDDGVGIPVGVDIMHTETLGLQIVTLLARQLHGTIEFVNDAGASFTICFRLPSLS
ncbi:MAG: hypothetical protein EHM79_17150 [Geobacter sp.]|nr:MAG: hypothetical protein EHM79_17150 [Geobacter sp.]